MYEVTYTIMQHNGQTRLFKRMFHDEEMARSEVTFSTGMTLTTGEKIVNTKMKRLK